MPTMYMCGFCAEEVDLTGTYYSSYPFLYHEACYKAVQDELGTVYDRVMQRNRDFWARPQAA